MTRNNQVKVTTLTGTPFSYRDGDWGVEIWKSRKRLGVYRTYLSAQINCVMLFLESPESKNHGAKNVLERLLTEKDQTWFLAIDHKLVKNLEKELESRIGSLDSKSFAVTRESK